MYRAGDSCKSSVKEVVDVYFLPSFLFSLSCLEDVLTVQGSASWATSLFCVSLTSGKKLFEWYR